MRTFSGMNNVKITNWERFEIESCQYLNELYRNPVSFRQEGGKNSAISDIKVYIGGEYSFSIEVKYSPCQSGQFVLVEENGIYKLSSESKNENNKYTQEIIDFLNENMERYTPTGQSAISIKFDQEVFAQWIIQHYKRKESYFIITSNKLSKYKAILPIVEIKNNFDITAVIRRKRSGTADVAQYRRSSCLMELEKHLREYGMKVSEVTQQSRKTLVKFNKNLDLKNSERYFGDDFFLSPNSNGEGYYLKTRSRTNNLNVIFNLVYRGPEKDIGTDLLEKYLRTLSVNQ